MGKKIKSNAICHRDRFIAIGKDNKLLLFDLSGNEIFSIKLRKKIMCIDIGETIVVGTEWGVHAISIDGRVIWEVNCGPIHLVKFDDLILAASFKRLVAVSREGEVLWENEFGNIIFEIRANETIKVYVFKDETFVISFDGKIIGKELKEFDFKFLPIPWIIVKKEIEKLWNHVNLAKKVDLRRAKKLLKRSEKLFKEARYGEAFEILIKCTDEIRNSQVEVSIDKKPVVGKVAILTIRVYNFLHEVLEGLEVDVSDIQKYFEVEEPTFKLPPLRLGTCIEKKVELLPKYEGSFIVFIKLKSTKYTIKKRMEVEVKAPGIISRIFRREKQVSLAELIKY